VTNLREKGDDWPQAKLHTQTPGTGKPGDPIFDAAFARGVASIQSNAEQGGRCSTPRQRCWTGSGPRF
jgi:hypothetical protein